MLLFCRRFARALACLTNPQSTIIVLVARPDASTLKEAARSAQVSVCCLPLPLPTAIGLLEWWVQSKRMQHSLQFAPSSVPQLPCATSPSLSRARVCAAVRLRRQPSSHPATALGRSSAWPLRNAYPQHSQTNFLLEDLFRRRRGAALGQ